MSSGTRAACVVTAAVLLLLSADGVRAQGAPVSGDPLEVAIDPSAPLDPMPDIDLDWPDLDAPEPADPEAEPIDPAAVPEAQAATTSDSVAELRYSLSVEGLDDVPQGDAIRALFAANSALDKNDDDPANAAQLDRQRRRAVQVGSLRFEASAQLPAGVAVAAVLEHPGEQLVGGLLGAEIELRVLGGREHQA